MMSNPKTVEEYMEGLGFSWQPGGVVSEHGVWQKPKPDEMEPLFVNWDVARFFLEQSIRSRIDTLYSLITPIWGDKNWGVDDDYILNLNGRNVLGVIKELEALIGKDKEL